MATSPHTPTTRDHVLHIRKTPLARTKIEGLRAVGVEVTQITPDEVMGALEEPAERGPMTRRVADAKFCVLDEGTGARLAATIFTIRQHAYGSTFTTVESLREVGQGIMLGRNLTGDSAAYCEFVPAWDILKTLRGLGAPNRVAPLYVPIEGQITRPPRPLPYVSDPSAYTDRDLYTVNDFERGALNLLTGRLAPRELLDEGASEKFLVGSKTALLFLIKHLPTDELHLLGTREAGAYWESAVEVQDALHPGPWQRLADLGDGREAFESLLWHALARDGGSATLAMMPPTLAALRDEVVGQWDRTVATVAERLPHELVQPLSCDQRETLGTEILKEWGVVPCDDPLAPDADPNLFRPTLTTLRVARRYRSAPEVLLAARDRWGGRPYLETRAADQLRKFAQESPPASAAELEAWVRLLRSLPVGRMQGFVRMGVELGWPRVDAAVADTWWPGTPQLYLAAVESKLPCLTSEGEVREDILGQLTDHEALCGRIRVNAANRRRTHAIRRGVTI